MKNVATDMELLHKIRQKDGRSLEVLIGRYSRYIVAVIVHVSGRGLPYQDIEEICSDVFIKIWTNSSTIAPAYDTLKPYLAAIARNMTINRLKQLPTQCFAEISDVEAASGTNETDAIGLKESLNSAISFLKQPDRDLFVRRYFLSESVKRLSDKFGLNPNTTATKLSRARKVVAKKLKEGEDLL